ncbi:MAG: ATP synthase F1 subunit delta, partial [Candidatus Omnitrophica bacterium 4484_213]
LFQRHLGFALGRLHNLNQDVLNKEEELRKRQEEIEIEYAEKMKQAAQEVEEIRNKANEEALLARDKILDQAKTEKAKLIERAIAEKRKQEKQLETKIAQQGRSLASNLIEYIFSKEIKEAIHIQLVDELIEKLQATSHKLQARNNEQAEITSVYPLKAEQKKRLIKTLSEKVGQNIELKEKIDKEIIGGVIIKLGDIVIDGSLKNKLRKAMEQGTGSG